MRVAAIQMTSGHDIDANLEAAGRFLADAARLDAMLAALPENFAFMGLNSGDKRAVAEPDGAGRIQNFLADTARRLKIWIVGGTVPLRQDADGRVAAACLVYKSDGQRAARYDKIHLFDVDVPGSTESHRESAHTVAGPRPARGGNPGGQAWARGVLRHALPGAVPGVVAAGRRSVRGAVGVHGAHGQGALGIACCGRAPSRICAA